MKKIFYLITCFLAIPSTQAMIQPELLCKKGTNYQKIIFSPTYPEGFYKKPDKESTYKQYSKKILLLSKTVPIDVDLSSYFYYNKGILQKLHAKNNHLVITTVKNENAQVHQLAQSPYLTVSYVCSNPNFKIAALSNKKEITIINKLSDKEVISTIDGNGNTIVPLIFDRQNLNLYGCSFDKDDNDKPFRYTLATKQVTYMKVEIFMHEVFEKCSKLPKDYLIKKYQEYIVIRKKGGIKKCYLKLPKKLDPQRMSLLTSCNLGNFFLVDKECEYYMYIIPTELHTNFWPIKNLFKPDIVFELSGL